MPSLLFGEATAHQGDISDRVTPSYKDKNAWRWAYRTRKTPMSALLTSPEAIINCLHLPPRRLRSPPMQDFSGGCASQIPYLDHRQEAHCFFFQDCGLDALQSRRCG